MGGRGISARDMGEDMKAMDDRLRSGRAMIIIIMDTDTDKDMGKDMEDTLEAYLDILIS